MGGCIGSLWLVAAAVVVVCWCWWWWWHAHTGADTDTNTHTNASLPPFFPRLHQQAAKLNIEVTSKPQAVDEIDRKLIQLEMAKISLENEPVRGF